MNDNFKGVATTDTLGGKQEITTINEAGLYSLIFRSRKAEAKAFQDWVTGVVLPTLRQDGLYITSEEKLVSEDATPDEVHHQFKQLTAQVVQALDEKALRYAAQQEEKLARGEAFRLINRSRKRKPRTHSE